MASVEEPAAPRLLVPVLVIGLLVGVVVVLAWPTNGTRDARTRGHDAATGAVTSVASSRAETVAAGLLRDWDRRRAAAWAAGDAASLSRLYVPGSSAAAADVAMLRDWTARGLAVDALTTQLLSVRVLAHTAGRWVVRVRDRVTGARVTGAGVAGAGGVERLPAGATAVRDVELRRVGAEWRVASVRPAPSAGRR